MISLQTGPAWTVSSAASGLCLLLAFCGIFKAFICVLVRANNGTVFQKVTLKQMCCTFGDIQLKSLLFLLNLKQKKRYKEDGKTLDMIVEVF